MSVISSWEIISTVLSLLTRHKCFSHHTSVPKLSSLKVRWEAILNPNTMAIHFDYAQGAFALVTISVRSK